MMIVRVRGETQVRNDGAQVQHGRELNPQLSRGMHRDADLESLANTSRLDAWFDAAPERGVEENHVDGGIQNVRRQLFEVHDDRVRSEWNPNHLTGAAHAIETEYRIFEVIVAKIFNSLSEANGLLGGPGAVGIEANR